MTVDIKPGGARAADAACRELDEWGPRAAVAGAVVATVVQLVDFGAFGLRVGILNMDTHVSMFGVISMLALVAAWFVAVLLAAARTTRREASVLLPWLLAALLALRALHPAGVLVFALPFAVLTLGILWGAAPPSTRARALIRAGCVTLIGSYAIHAFGGSVVSSLGYGAQTWPYQIALTVRHSSELAGWAIVAAGLASLYTARGNRPVSPA